MDPASIAFAALAEEYRRAGQFTDAIATCEAGLLRHPAYLSARVTLGRSLIELGRYEDAEEQLEHVLHLAPENLAAIRGLAEIHHRRGELPEALEQDRSGAPTAAGNAATPAPLPSLAPSDAVPVHAAAVEAEPVERVPVESAPVQSAPVEPVPVQSASVQPAPIQPAPIQPAPVQRAPIKVAVSRADSPAPVSAVDPDVAALPALDAFLAAIIRAKDALPRRHS